MIYQKTKVLKQVNVIKTTIMEKQIDAHMNCVDYIMKNIIKVEPLIGVYPSI